MNFDKNDHHYSLNQAVFIFRQPVTQGEFNLFFSGSSLFGVIVSVTSANILTIIT